MQLDRQISVKITNMAFVCALMVVVIHVWCEANTGSVCWWLHELSANGICRIAVPFFFSVSGYFLGRRIGEPHWYWTAIRKRLVSIGIPYALWNVIAFFFFGALYYCCTRQIRLDERGVMWNLVQVVGLDFTTTPPLFPLWFLRTLLVWFCFSFVFQLLGNCRIRWVAFMSLIVVLGALPLFLSGEFRPVVFGLASLDGAAYFPVGVCLSKMGWQGAISKSTGLFGLMLGGGLFVGKAVSLLMNRPMVSTLLGWAAIPLCLVGIWWLIPIATADRLKSVVCLTFPIYIIHNFVIKVFELSMNVLGVGQCLRVTALGFAFRAVLLCICSIAFARLLCQGRFGIIAFGGRGRFAVSK